jgi:hypothetical protein
MQNFLLFTAALFLLCWPTAWLCRGRVRLFPIGNLMENPSLVGSWLGSVVWWNLGRAWLGVWLLRHVEAEVLGPASRAFLIIGYNGIVQIAGLAMQMLFYRARDTEVPVPISYACGILLAVLPPTIALPAVAFGAVASVGARSLAVGWASTGLFVAVLGVLLAVSKIQLAKFGLFFAFPLAWIVGSNRQFVLPVVRSSADSAVRPAFASRLR